jgi:regulator of nucleoside diphosphate kinase
MVSNGKGPACYPRHSLPGFDTAAENRPPGGLSVGGRRRPLPFDIDRFPAILNEQRTNTANNRRGFCLFLFQPTIMTNREICITENDRKRLTELIRVAHDFGDRIRHDLKGLEEELSKAKVVASQDIPPDVVTMNSKVVLVDVDTHEEMNFRLVFPQDADVDMGFISVLAPIGTAILGYAKGDIVEWPVPSGVRRLQIKDILYQPEAAGDFHL